MERKLLTKAQLIEALKSREEDLLAIKKMELKRFNSNYVSHNELDFTDLESKAIVEGEDTDEVLKRVLVGSTAWWVDDYGDVTTPESWKNAKANIKRLKLLKNHDHSLDGIIGSITNVANARIELSKIGIDKDGLADVLLFYADIKRKYDQKIFDLYADNEVTEHSIGYYLIKGTYAVNSNDLPNSKAIWDKAYPKLINKEKADSLGWFFLFQEIKIMELSGVVWGGNEKTPTLAAIKAADPILQSATQQEPIITPEKKKSSYYKKLLTING